MNAATPVTGLDLKLARVAARVKQRQLGQAMGVSESRVSSIERESFVTAELAARYRTALDTCRAPSAGQVA